MEVKAVVAERVLEKVMRAVSYLPTRLRDEILRLSESRAGGASEIREIRVRRGGRSVLQIGMETVPLFTVCEEEEMSYILEALCGGSLYAYRSTVNNGYISVPGGIRVGLCGLVRYDEGGAMGVSDISTFVFRIPGHSCAFSDELERIYRSGVGGGMLIYSPPGVGKTTALRSLAASLGTGRNALRVAVVDERLEFSSEDYSDCYVDVLQGYKKSNGIEIASRTLSPEVIIVDEIGREESDEICAAVKCGIPIVATAHAGELSELLSKWSLSPLFDQKVFGVAVGISYRRGCYSLTVDRL